MTDEQMQVFMTIAKRYFEQMGDDVMVDTPYWVEDVPNLLDCTGVIGISGAHQGVVYMTASHELLAAVLSSIGEHDDGERNRVDLVGEIANTIAGNARTEFGNQFYISIPLVFAGAPDGVVLPKGARALVIAIQWQGKKGEIVVCIQDKRTV